MKSTIVHWQIFLLILIVGMSVEASEEQDDHILLHTVIPIQEGNRIKQKKKIEIIPSDESLLQPEVSEDVEDLLANTKVGGNVIKRRRWAGIGEENTLKLLNEMKAAQENIEHEIKKLQSQIKLPNKNEEANILVRVSRELVHKAEMLSRRKRRSEILLPYKTCVYIDIPGTETHKIDGEFLVPETFTAAFPKNSHETEFQSLSSSQDTESEDATVENVLWLHMPQNNPLDIDEMRTRLYDTVDTLHHEGKDVLFIPISKGYSNTEDVKHGFLKSLQITPERFNRYKKLEIKRL